MQVLAQFVAWFLRLYSAHELPALFGFLLIEEAGVPLPLPGDTLVILAGAQHHSSLAYSLLVFAISTAAVFSGSSILYFSMRRGGRPLMERYGKYMHLTPQRLERVERWFRRHGAVAIIIGRLIPGLRIPTTVVAGIAEVPYRVFLLSTLIAAMIWSLGYFYAGIFIQGSATYVAARMAGVLDIVGDWVLLLAIIALLTSAGGFTFWRWYRAHRVARALPTSEQSSPIA